MKRASRFGAAGLVAALALAGCSATGRSAGTTGVRAPVAVITAPAQGSDQTPTSTPDSVPTDAGSGQQLSAVDSDLAGVDAATSQTDADTGAADSAQAQSDSP